jgi:Fe-S-cluster-containing hydrogenase component 2
MMKRQTVWVDAARCTGCGACVEVCPVGAIALVGGKARVDEETCIGCEACVTTCPEGAIQPVVHGELVPVLERPVPTIRQPSPLAETAGAVAVATGVGLLAQAGRALVRAVERWLTRPPAEAVSPVVGASPMAESGGAAGRGGQGRRVRRRRRGS